MVKIEKIEPTEKKALLEEKELKFLSFVMKVVEKTNNECLDDSADPSFAV